MRGPEHHAGLLARRGAARARRSTRKASTGWATRCGSSIPTIPRKGLVFDGRLAEDFKLSTGTWVSVGPLRARILAHGGGLVQDVVIAGPRPRLRRRAGRSRTSRAAARCARDLPDAAPPRHVLDDPRVRARFQALLAALAAREHRQLDARRARRCCSTSRRRSTPARSPTRDRSTRRPCSQNRAALRRASCTRDPPPAARDRACEAAMTNPDRRRTAHRRRDASTAIDVHVHLEHTGDAHARPTRRRASTSATSGAARLGRRSPSTTARGKMAASSSRWTSG